MKRLAKHPHTYLASEWIDILRKDAFKAEKKGQLTENQLRLFYDQGWFKALMPRRYGGLQWDFSRVVAFEEAIGWAEGSAGWVFTLCSGAGWFGAYIQPEMAARILKPKKACLAGSGQVGGVVKENRNGEYQVSGNWNYATGAPQATIFTANAFVEKEQRVTALLL